MVIVLLKLLIPVMLEDTVNVKVTATAFETPGCISEGRVVHVTVM